MTTLPSNIGEWIVIDSGFKTGEEHMGIDRFALHTLMAQPNTRPLIRFFQWGQPTVSYGYLLDPTQVEAWGKEQEATIFVKRPSGGGAVHHKESDLSLSLLWPRGSRFLPENPRTCYELIHDALKEGLNNFASATSLSLSLYKADAGQETCQTNAITETTENGAARFSVCFQEPVCNDVMNGKVKIIGGALRLTKHAILYQGHVVWHAVTDSPMLKLALLQALTPILTPSPDLVTLP